MSKHHHHDECCYGMAGYGMPGYGMAGYGFGAGYGGGGGGCGGYGGSWGIRWIYALLVLIVIVLQFARREVPAIATTTACDDGAVVASPAVGTGFFGGEFIDRSVLFIIVVFLLILCGGCWSGGWGNYGAAGGTGCGYGGGYGY